MLAERYDKVLYQRNREDIINELKDLEGDTKGGHRVHFSKTVMAWEKSMVYLEDQWQGF